MTSGPRLSRAVATMVLAVAACGRHEREPAPTHATLPVGVAALVGTQRVEVDTVVRVAAAARIPVAAARERAISDALLAAGAKSRFGASSAHFAETSARARAVLESITAEARAAGPPNDAEVAEVTESRWWELDQPPLRRTTHAVVVVDKPEQENAARALAERIAAATAGATSPASFRALARAVTESGLTVKVEDLQPVAADGRSVDPAAPPPAGSQTARYSPAYAAAASAVPGLLRQSGVIRTEFGFHVILVTELFPERRVSLEDRRRLLEPEVQIRRAAALERAALERARLADRVAVERSAASLTEQVKLPP